MGKGDNRRTPKMRRRVGQKRKKEQQRKLQVAIGAKGRVTAPPPKATAAAQAKSGKVTVKRSGQRKVTAAAQPE